MGIFQKELFFNSDLDTGELLDRLETCLRPGASPYKYQGKIDRKNNTFRILPVFDYGTRNYVRPEITGVLTPHQEKDSVSVQLKFRLPKEIAIVYLVLVILNLFTLTLLFLIPGTSDVRGFMTLALLAAFAGVFLIGLYTFHWKSDDSAKVLKRIFNGKTV